MTKFSTQLKKEIQKRSVKPISPQMIRLGLWLKYVAVGVTVLLAATAFAVDILLSIELSAGSDLFTLKQTLTLIGSELILLWLLATLALVTFAGWLFISIELNYRYKKRFVASTFLVIVIGLGIVIFKLHLIEVLGMF